jgi:hypothetical protein
MEKSASANTTEESSGFDQIATGLRTAAEEFEKSISKENVLALVALMEPVVKVSQKALSFTVGYTRRHPIRIAITLATLGLVAAKVMRSRPTLNESRT